MSHTYPSYIGPMNSTEQLEKTKWKELTYDQRINIMMDVINDVYRENVYLKRTVDKLLSHKHIDGGQPVNIEQLNRGESVEIPSRAISERFYSPFDQFDFSDD